MRMNRASFIAFPERIEYQVKFLEKNNDIDILGGRSEDIDESGAHIRYGGMPRTNPNYIKALLLFRCLDFRNGTTMMRRDFIDKYGLFSILIFNVFFKVFNKAVFLI